MSIFGSATSLAWHSASHAVHQVAQMPATRCVGLRIASLRPGVTSLLVARVNHSAETETFEQDCDNNHNPYAHDTYKGIGKHLKIKKYCLYLNFDLIKHY